MPAAEPFTQVVRGLFKSFLGPGVREATRSNALAERPSRRQLLQDGDDSEDEGFSAGSGSGSDSTPSRTMTPQIHLESNDDTESDAAEPRGAASRETCGHPRAAG